MSQKRPQLVIGLGNPGDNYKKTRHNAGFMVVDRIAEACSILFNKTKFDTLFGRGSIEGIDVVLAKPMAYMNRSGPLLLKLTNYFRISSEDMLVIHDDIDLAFGRLKIKEKGGDGGHKGIRSIIDAFNKDDFPRLRFGIGRGNGLPGARVDVTDHVLGRFSADEQMILNQIIDRAMNETITILCKGIKESMNIFNNKRNIILS